MALKYYFGQSRCLYVNLEIPFQCQHPRHDYILFSLTHGYNNCLFIGPKFSPANRPFRSPAFLCTAAPPAIPHARDITALVRRQPGCRWQQDQTDAASNAKSYTPGNV